MDIKYQDDIDKLVLNRMSRLERFKFFLLFGWRSEVKEQITFTKDVKHAIQSRNQKMIQMKKWEAEWEEEKRKTILACAEFMDDRERRIMAIRSKIEALRDKMEHEEASFVECAKELSSKIYELESQREIEVNEYERKKRIISTSLQSLENELECILNEK